MTPERYQQIGKLVEAALDLEPQQRAAFLDSACAGDHELRREVESLIASDEQARSFVAGGALEVDGGLMDLPQTQLAVAKRIGHYEIISQLGAGGMGEVYLARDTRLDRTVALKILPPQVASDEERMRRFVLEAKAASALNHPNVAHIYEIGENDGISFIAMEYVEGQTLAARIGGGPLDVAQVVEIGIQVADALEEAHGKGITHRDIKPANLMLTQRGQVKVLDFGLAKVNRLEKQEVDSNLNTLMQTAPGVMLGTMPYMSPEQALGRDVDHRSDLFSLGAVLYEIATGRRAFAGMNASETLGLILHVHPEAISDFNAEVPDELERIVRKCLEKDRERRYSSARELLSDLKNLKRDVEAGAPATVAEHQERRRMLLTSRGLLAVSALVMLVVMAALIYLLLFRRAPATSFREIKSVAVLPLENFSGDPAQEYFADGMTEALISNLARIRALKVISRTSAMRYKSVQKSLPEIARELNVDAVIEGSVQRSGGRVRVTVQLIHATTEVHLWVRDYDRDLTDVLKLQSDIARAVADEVNIQVTAEERARLASARNINREAHEAYLLGRYHFNKNNEQDWTQAIEHFQRATQIAPDYAAAYAGLSDAWLQRGIFGIKPLKEVEPPARAAALEALRLDEQLAEAHISLANLKQYYDWEWAGAETEFSRALELDPGSLQAHLQYGHLLMHLGRRDEAVREGQSALQLDPLSSETQTALGRFLYRARRYEEALPYLKRAVDMEPRSIGANFRLGGVYVQLGQYTEAIAVFEKGRELTRAESTFQAGIARVYALTGRGRDARRMIRGVKGLPDLIAGVYAALGDKDEAFRILGQAIEERNSLLVTLKEDPPFENLHKDPRWNELLRSMNFPPE